MFSGHLMGPCLHNWQVWLAHENPGRPLGAFPENTKRSRKVFLKPVEFCIFTHCAANRHQSLLLAASGGFCHPWAAPWSSTGHPTSPSALPGDQGRIAGQSPPCWVVREQPPTLATLLSTTICYSPHFGKLNQLCFPAICPYFSVDTFVIVFSALLQKGIC